MRAPDRPIIVQEVTDPIELAAAQVQDEQFDRNVAWFKEHASEVYTRHRGKFICVAGAELFVADTPETVLSMAKTAHPEDNGRYLRYIPREKVARIYVHPRRVASLR